MGVDFAFPSTTVTIEQFPEKKALDLNYNKSRKTDTAIENVISDFSKNNSSETE